MNLKQLAEAVAGTAAALDTLSQLFLSEAERLDVIYRREHNGNPHPAMERRGDLLRAAVRSRIDLARLLDLSPINPPINLAQICADKDLNR